MTHLVEEVRELAMAYLVESDDGDDYDVNDFPLSIANYVIEYALQLCNFPKTYTSEKKIEELTAHKNALAMACVDVYLKIGTEGQKSYSSNGVTRHFKSEWIDSEILKNLPNYCRSL